ncbi:RluA family pseudouridine synthase [Anaerococcus obesiensis]|uniref:Pseudouridine synthase n=1 Tax=Anaerococcus obesiensis TaxID=1287640 RepID=A0A7T7USK8_9FIRM|nr:MULTISPECIES: RluA family pseudouridine synthase [Anaerococcus]MDU5251894.1 RluA family pseudouridine synthase [Anaerococcus vaginalis]MDU6781343.1 RluA family pseudouridine synthase [Anaerococcus vaginalis]QQN55429.1 RluA family pseudouridine synthase [Anaerococcus obesiensis]
MKIKANKEIRIDKYLSDIFEEIPREKVKDFIKDEKIKVNNKKIKPSYKLILEDEIEISDKLFEKEKIEAEKMNLKIIYENEDYAIIDKDENVIVHPAGSIVSGTLVNGLLDYFGYDNLSHIGGDDRPGIVHRLDKDTTGLMVIAKNNSSYKYLKNLFETRKIDKEYLAICNGIFQKKSGTIQTFMDRDPNNRRKMAVRNSGRDAISKYEVISENNGYSLVKIKILTGRTHQIRVHMTHINHPLLGDPVYGNVKHKFNLDHQLLHCHKLGFTDKNGIYREFCADCHEDFKKYQKILGLGE